MLTKQDQFYTLRVHQRHVVQVLHVHMVGGVIRVYK
jgi:hypothetical protein